MLRDEHADVIRESVKTIAREIMEAEVSELTGAELGDVSPEGRKAGEGWPPEAGARPPPQA